MAARIKKGDEVIISGRDKGKKGTVIKVLTDLDRVFVQGVHMVKRHQVRPRRSKAVSSRRRAQFMFRM